MAVREIRLFGDPVLRTKCTTIGVIDDGIRGLVKDLLDTVALPGRAGVAAPQIGVALRAFSYNVDGEIGYILNPVLKQVSGEPVATGEGCLSVPAIWGEARRHPWARVEGIDLDENRVVLEGEGLFAQMLQHETDHLNGIVYLSRLMPEDRRKAMAQVRESSWF